MKRFSGKFEIVLFTVFIIVLLAVIFRPIPVNRDNSIEFNTTVQKVGEGAEKNVILKLEKGRGTYFIRQGVDKGLNIENLRKELVNKEVTVFYLKPSFMSGFSPVSNTRYITELRVGDKIIYSEL